jgi:hypothetical protein
MEPNSGLEVKVVDWSDGNREVAIYFLDFNQMITLSVESARTLAFLLTECSDFIQPPFNISDTDPTNETESFFGPYEETESENNDEDEEKN